MHKFFYNYNKLTEKYELTENKNFVFSPISQSLSANNLTKEIEQNIQELYKYIIISKDKTDKEDSILIINEIELLISNLYYSFYNNPLDLVKDDSNFNYQELINHSFKLISDIEEKINIPQYNRVCLLIKNKLQLLML